MANNSASLKPLPADPATLICAEDVPQYVPLARQTLARWRHEGRGPRYVKLGRRIAYRVRDLQEFVESSLRSSTSEVGA